MHRRIYVGVRSFYRDLDTKLGLMRSHREIEKPIFILGCGRSGTTILGTALSSHPQVTYLNERRDLWTAAYPVVNIWGQARGKLVLTEADAHERQSQRLRTIFYYQTLKTNRPVLVEKLPINNFRVRFLNAIFPDAIYIHILRNGVEVAKSIQRKATWYSKHDYRWQQLLNYALSNPATAGLPALCDDDYDRGLLEWRLSLDALYSDLPKLNES